MCFNQADAAAPIGVPLAEHNLQESHFMTFPARFPAPYIKPCARSDPNINECAAKHGNEAIPELVKGKCHAAGGVRALY
jgi:hypothetical protein